jgi:hypothetical protein
MSMGFETSTLRNIAICYPAQMELENTRIFVAGVGRGKANRIIVKAAVTFGTIIPSKRATQSAPNPEIEDR